MCRRNERLSQALLLDNEICRQGKITKPRRKGIFGNVRRAPERYLQHDQDRQEARKGSQSLNLPRQSPTANRMEKNVDGKCRRNRQVQEERRAKYAGRGNQRDVPNHGA